MPSYQQNRVIDQLNKYLKSKRRKLKLEYGYCHGLTLLWLYKMSEGKEQWFYDLIKKIVDHKGNNFDRIEMDIEKLINHIEWLQNSNQYVTKIQQLNIKDILEKGKTFSLSYIFNHPEFTQILNQTLRENSMICLSGPEHTIGIFVKDGTYYLFDPNYDEGMANEFTSITDLKNEIIQSLFTEFKLKSQLLPITINVASTAEIINELESHKMKLFKEFTRTRQKANAMPNEDISPLYIACESGDETEVKILLSKKVNVNYQLKDGSTALYIAAQNGYNNIVKKLLEHKADPNICMSNLVSPLKAAAENGHVDVVNSLLNANANIDDVDIDKESALEAAVMQNHLPVVKCLLARNATPGPQKKSISCLKYAIENRNWEMTLLILNHVSTPLVAKDLIMLRKYRKKLMHYLEENSHVNIHNSELKKLLKPKQVIYKKNYSEKISHSLVFSKKRDRQLKVAPYQKREHLRIF